MGDEGVVRFDPTSERWVFQRPSRESCRSRRLGSIRLRVPPTAVAAPTAARRRQRCCADRLARGTPRPTPGVDEHPTGLRSGVLGRTAPRRRAIPRSASCPTAKVRWAELVDRASTGVDRRVVRHPRPRRRPPAPATRVIQRRRPRGCGRTLGCGRERRRRGNGGAALGRSPVVVVDADPKREACSPTSSRGSIFTTRRSTASRLRLTISSPRSTRLSPRPPPTKWQMDRCGSSSPATRCRSTWLGRCPMAARGCST